MRKEIISVLSLLTGAVIGAGAVEKSVRKTADKAQEMADKHFELFLMMNQWVRLKQEGKSLTSCFEKMNIKKIAIYGMNHAGETLLNELRGTDITVAYGIDRNAEEIYLDVDVVTLDDPLEDVDAVVVTAITYFEEIKEALSEKFSCRILSLDDLIYDF